MTAPETSLREQIARLIDPEAWETADAWETGERTAAERHRIIGSLDKAGRIAALRSPITGASDVGSVGEVVERLRAVVPYQGKSAVAFLCHEAADFITSLAAERDEAVGLLKRFVSVEHDSEFGAIEDDARAFLSTTGGGADADLD